MLDIGWSELLVIAIVLIVVVGPKDLPPMLRAFGKMTANLRRMAGDFRTQFDEALRESELDDVRKTIADAQKLNPANALRDAINPLRKMGEEIKSDMRKATAPPPALKVPPLSEEPVAAPPTPADAPTPPAAAGDVALPPLPVNLPADPPPVPVGTAAKPKPARKPRAAAAEKTGAAKPRKAPAKKAAAAGTAARKPAARKKVPADRKDEA